MTPFGMQRAGALLQGQPMAWASLLRSMGGFEEEANLLDPLAYMQQQWGIQDRMIAEQRQYRDVGLGIRQEQLGARRGYLGRVWGIQDQMSALGYRQQQASFDYQERARELQGRQFREGWQLSMEQFGLQTGYQRERMGFGYQTGLLQRGWQREDWETSEGMARMQFGWRQEDLSRSLRYARGPERGQIQREQRRERVLENERRRQFEQDKDRQETLWGRQDERYSKDLDYFNESTRLSEQRLQMQRRHFEEREELSEDYHEEQKSFIGERRALEEQLREEQRAWQEDQLTWEEEALERQIEHNEEMDKHQDAQRDVQRGHDALLASIQWWLFGGGEKPEGAGGKGSLWPTFLDALDDGVGRAEKIAKWMSEWNVPSAPAPTEEEEDKAGKGPGAQFGTVVPRDMNVRAHRGEIVFNPQFPRADLAKMVAAAAGSGEGMTEATGKAILAALLQLQNVFRGATLSVDGRVIAAVLSPYLEESQWDQSHQF
jgi:hypothetical protein